MNEDIRRAKSQILEENLKDAIELITGERPARAEQNGDSVWFMSEDGIWYFVMIEECFSQEDGGLNV
ncbi:MAG: hypothetical protein CL398_11695 [Acidiferrobacteraceae bacterium]|nr:hypothetical protein [Acidiferrobacteraceae bacterium]|tara:strand:+ start:821 stop:1021 length:201 start_codon:yes stop_codon:yes gene_type:complete